MTRRIKFLAFANLLFLSLLFPSPAQAALYSFSNFTFNTCGAIGQSGPSLSNCQSSYSSASWASSTSNLNVTSGIQSWTVPFSGTFRIIAKGASGGNGRITNGGFGTQIQGDFNLVQGSIIKIVVGQQGQDGSYNGGGGGGTYVMDNSNSALVIAGGGGGGGYSANGTTINATISDPSAAGWYGSGSSSLANGVSGGSGGNIYNSSCISGGGGGGASGDGGSNSGGSIGGKSFLNGSVGGTGTGGSLSGSGGFGGGGGGDWSCYTGGGGGGGYSGGSGGYYYGNGGGGSSINNGSNKNSLILNAAGAGSVSISSLLPALSTPAAPILTSPSATTITVSETSTISNALSYVATVYAANGTTFIESSTIASSSITSSATLSGLSPSTAYYVTIYAIGDGTSYINSAESPQSAITTLAGISTITLSITGGNNPPKKLGSTTITASINTAGTVSFYFNGRLLHCVPLTVVTPGSTTSCTWKPTTTGQVNLTAKLAPTSSSYAASSSNPLYVTVGKRTTSR